MQKQDIITEVSEGYKCISDEYCDCGMRREKINEFQ